MGKTFKDRARWERKNERFKEQRSQPPRFNDRNYRGTSQVVRVPQSTANTGA